MASDSIMLLACGDIVPPGRAVIIGMATMADSVLRAPGTQIIVESRDLPIRLAQLASTVGTQTDTVETGCTRSAGYGSNRRWRCTQSGTSGEAVACF
jgi:hypothetical protein